MLRWLCAAVNHRAAHPAVLPFGVVLLHSMLRSDRFLNSAEVFVFAKYQT